MHLKPRGIDSECLELISSCCCFFEKVIPLCGAELWLQPSLVLNTVIYHEDLKNTKKQKPNRGFKAWMFSRPEEK